ncbi:MAG: hypothetical protein MUC63_02375 [Planctomycetes bacterium]|jgi:hypothetical protein|nr:hypothetical protein [Planctomycetota bacterium]
MHRRAIIWGAALAALAAGGCPRSGGNAGPPAPALAEALRENEALRAERRDLALKSRDLARARDALQAELERARVREAEARAAGEAALGPLRARVAELERELQQAQGTAEAEAADPGPEGLKRLFLTAVRRRDREATASLVDWEGFVEAALRSASATEADGDKALADFRAQPAEARKERIERARAEFLSFLFGERGPRLDGAEAAPEGGFLRSRVRDDSRGLWDVILRKTGTTWKVVGMVRQPVPAEGGTGGNEGDGEGEEKRE